MNEWMQEGEAWGKSTHSQSGSYLLLTNLKRPVHLRDERNSESGICPQLFLEQGRKETQLEIVNGNHNFTIQSKCNPQTTLMLFS